MLNQQLAWSMEYFFILPRDHSHFKMWKELSLENNKKFLGLGPGSSIIRNMRKSFLLEKYKEIFRAWNWILSQVALTHNTNVEEPIFLMSSFINSFRVS